MPADRLGLPTLSDSRGGRRQLAMDGYRGLFVTLVLLFHFGVTALVGGWVGINHFFVFSGFLIARLLIGERARHGDLDLRRFYRRRAERVLPALLVLLAAVLLHAALLATPAIRHRVGGDSLASLFFVQNWNLVARGDSYFDLLGDPSPLRHLWTLGVEEQFYVLVPGLVALLFLRRVRRRTRVLLVVAAALAATMWAAWVAAADPDLARLYYGTDTRAQALLAGVALAVALGRDDDGRVGRRPPHGVVLALGVLGLLISFSAFFVVDPTSEWIFTHGGMALFTLGAVLMVLSATDPRPSLLNRAFSWGPLVTLGQMSYGLYLYHWPIHLWLSPHLSSLPLWVSVLIQCALTFAVAAVSFRYLEVPVLRRGARALLPGRRDVRPLVAGVLAAVALPAAALFVLNPAGVGPTGDGRSPEAAGTGSAPALVAGQPEYDGAPATIGLVGDSVPYYLAERFPAESYPGVTLDSHAGEGCDLLDAPLSYLPGTSKKTEPWCQDIKDSWAKGVQQAGDEVLLVFASPLLGAPHLIGDERLWVGDAAFREVVTDRLDEIRADAKGAGVRQVQVVNVPCRTVPDDAPPDVRSAWEAQPEQLAEYQDPVLLNGLLEDWAGRHDDVAVIDLDAALCADGYPDELHGLPVYNDVLHFSPEATPMIWRWILGQSSTLYAR